MPRTTIFAALLLASATSVAGQTSDTLDARGYFPLESGNSWEYEHYLQRFPTGDEIRFERYSVVGAEGGDGTGDFGIELVERDAAGALLRRDTVLVRFDSAASSLVGDRLFGILRFLTCLNAPYEPADPSPPECWPFVSRDSVRSTPLFGEIYVPVKQFGTFVWAMQAVHGIGVLRVSGGCEPCGPFADMDTWELRFANLGGEQFGAQVVTKEYHESVAPHGLQIFPRPAHAWATVESEVPGAVTIYDILGRVVMQSQAQRAGRTRIDLSALSRGVYLVRMGGQSETLIVQ